MTGTRLRELADPGHEREQDIAPILAGAPFVLVSQWHTCLCLDPRSGDFIFEPLETCGFNLRLELRDGRIRAAAAAPPDATPLADAAPPPDAGLAYDVAPVRGTVAVRRGDRFLSALPDNRLAFTATRRLAWEEFHAIPLARAQAEAAERQRALAWSGWASRSHGHAMRPQAFPRQPGGQASIRVSGPLSEDAPLHIVVSQLYGRLGNNVMQFLNAVIAGLVLRAASVRLLPPHHVGLAGERRVGDTVVRPGDPSAHVAREALTISGQFYAPVGLEGVFAAATGQTLLDASAAVGALLPLTPGASAFEPDRTVVAHFRGGDVFRADPHHWYAQPPAAHYVRAALQARERHGVDCAHLVHEDESNPALAAVAEQLAGLGFRVSLQSSTVAADFSTLRQARHLILSFGTFADTAAMLSSEARSVWGFHTLGCQIARNGYTGADQAMLPAMLRAKGVSAVVGIDASGTCAKPRQWTASAEQRALLTSLPLDAIRLEAG